MINLPAFCNLPDKLMPMIERFNEFRYFMLEGGRGGGKSQGVVRFALYLAEQLELRICGGRETQNSIEESIYTLARDVINDYDLNFEVQASKIIHRVTGTPFTFKGFREQGAWNIKGLEGVDLLIIDEAQAITKRTLDVIIPTIRKENAKIIFMMNRYLRNDAVYKEFADRPDCLHIHLNYFDNPFCSGALRKEAEICKAKDDRDYQHIWLGNPLEEADDFLFTAKELDNTQTFEFYYNEASFGHRVMGVDIARYGQDDSVAVVLEQKGPDQWEQIHREKWSKRDLMDSVGRVLDLKMRFKPDISVVDCDGIGAGVCDRINQEKEDSVVEYHNLPAKSDEDWGKNFGNNRTKDYYTIKDMIQLSRLRIKDIAILKDLEEIRFEYSNRNVKRIVSKEKMKTKHNVGSPDHSDALAMAISEIGNISKVYEKKTHQLPEYASDDAFDGNYGKHSVLPQHTGGW